MVGTAAPVHTSVPGRNINSFLFGCPNGVFVLQGGEAAGLVAEDLGEPDAAGVYAQHTATGTLYFRQAQPHPFAVPHWEWSIDKQLWIPTSYVSVMPLAQ